MLSLCAYFIVNYFNLFSLSFAYIDIPIINNLYRFSMHPNLLSFFWISHIFLLPFIIVYWFFFVPIIPKKVENVSIIGFILCFAFFALLFASVCFIFPESLSERRRGSFQSIFENFIPFYFLCLYPLICLPWFFVFSLKNFRFVLKFRHYIWTWKI